MLRLVRVTVIIILLALIGALLAALTIEWPERVHAPAAALPVNSAVASEPETTRDPVSLINPGEVAKAFGYMEPIIIPIVAEPEPEPEPEPVAVPPVAEWVVPVGFVTSGAGEQRYVLKILKPRETIISLGIGETENGILLVALEGNTLVIDREEERYLVPLPR